MIINSGKFSFVKSNLIEEMDGFIIVYQIKPKFRLRQIEIIGSDKISNKKIKEKSELILGSLVDDVDFENAVKKIKMPIRNIGILMQRPRGNQNRILSLVLLIFQ